MEFVSDTQETEYSIKATYPPGKWFFYERILKVPNYIIFEPDSGSFEMYRLQNTEQYILQEPDENQRYWIAEMNLYLGVWQVLVKIAQRNGCGGGMNKETFYLGEQN
ncbi:hypothetical protein NSTCB13_04578 [Nostoc sp. DSM 114160]|jgi:Uma2 family endonuclease